MSYKLDKGKLSTRIKDSIATTLGFGTKRERIDQNLASFRRNDINQLNNIMAQRNLIISTIQNQINNYDRLIKPLEEYLKLYQELENLAYEEIIKPNSDIPITLHRQDNSVLATSNYHTLNKITTLSQNADIAVELIRELESEKERKKGLIINAFIQGNGRIHVNGKVIDNNDIYINFKKMQQLLSFKSLMNRNGISFNYQIFSFQDSFNLKKIIEKELNELSYQKNALVNQLNALNSAKSADQSTLDIIEAAKKVIMSSPEYVDAKASDDYLKEYHKR